MAYLATQSNNGSDEMAEVIVTRRTKGLPYAKSLVMVNLFVLCGLIMKMTWRARSRPSGFFELCRIPRLPLRRPDNRPFHPRRFNSLGTLNTFAERYFKYPMDAPSDTRQLFTRFPVVSLGAEHLVRGHLLRRNILTYKAPPNNEGYDLICIHPDPQASGPHVRVQVKSRLATDCDRVFPVKERTIKEFDFLIVAFLSVGYFFRKAKNGSSEAGRSEPEFYTFPQAFIRQHHVASSSWEKVQTSGVSIEAYRNERGFEQIAQFLKISYPFKATRTPTQVFP